MHPNLTYPTYPTVTIRLFAILGLLLSACSQTAPDKLTTSCSEDWYKSAEARIYVGDNQGHGPDLGSGEWKSAVEYKLGIRGDSSIPDRQSDAWCGYVEALLQAQHKH